MAKTLLNLHQSGEPEARDCAARELREFRSLARLSGAPRPARWKAYQYLARRLNLLEDEATANEWWCDAHWLRELGEDAWRVVETLRPRLPDFTLQLANDSSGRVTLRLITR